MKMSEGKSNNWIAEHGLVGGIAYTIARVSGDVFELIEMGREEKLKGCETIVPDVDEWLSLYREHRRVQRIFYNQTLPVVCGCREVGQIFNEWERGLKEIRGMSGEELKREVEVLTDEDWQDMEEIVEELQEGMEALPDLEPEVPEGFRLEDMFTAEVLFFLWVWLPCWYETGEAPVFVYRKARQGDMDALDALLRIDKAVMRDRLIAQHIHEAQLENPARTTFFQKAMQGDPRKQLTKKKVKCTAAGLISNVSEAMGQRLLEPEIRDLFDAIAQDEGKGRIDTDLPESPEAFSKAIQRERKFWNILPDYDWDKAWKQVGKAFEGGNE